MGRARRTTRRVPARRFEVSPIRTGYEPGYPRRLDPEELRDLLADRLPPRLRRAAAMAALAFGMQGCDPKAGGGDGREESDGSPPELRVDELRVDPPRAVAPDDVVDAVTRVFDEVRRTGGNYWRGLAELRRAEGDGRPFGSPRWIADIPIAYGNSLNGVFDVDLARRRARELFAAYGLTTNPARSTRAGAEARLDGVDREFQVAFEVRDLVKGDPLLFDFDPTPRYAGLDEVRPEDALDDDEAEALRGAGLKVHAADPQRVFDGDQGTAITTWMLGLVDFLNEVTDGPEFDPRLVLDEPQRFVEGVPEVVAGAAESIEVSPWYHVAGVRSATGCRVALVVDEAALESMRPAYRLRDHMRRRLDDPDERGDDPKTVGTNATPNGFVLVQERDRDGNELRVTGEANRMLAWPATFDPTKPFRIEMDVPPGDGRIGTRVILGSIR